MTQQLTRRSASVVRTMMVAPVAAAALALAGWAAPAAAQSTTTSTTLAPTTTTSTTLAPTTSTAAPTTTSGATSTTTPETTTTRQATTTAVGTTSGTSTTGPPWAAIVALVAVVLAVILVVVLLVGASRRRRAEAAWLQLAGPALDKARLAVDLLASQATAPDDRDRREAVRLQVDRAVAGLQQVADTATDKTGRLAAASSAQSLRDLGFAVEADRLLRHGPAAPTGAQLAQADAARRDRASVLEASLAALAQRIGPTAGHRSTES